MSEEYAGRGVQALIVDVGEPAAAAAGWAARSRFSFPVLLDGDGAVAERYAPEGLLPDLPRSQVPIASNLIIDRDGKVRFFSLLDSAHFDARLVRLRAALDGMLRAEAGPLPIVSVAPIPELRLRPSGAAEATLRVSVKDGFHVQANPASQPYLIPLRLELAAQAAVRADRVVYPPGQPHRLQGSSQDLATYAGSLDLRVAVEAARDAPAAAVTLRGQLHYQACDERVCLRPATLAVELPVRIETPR